MAKAGPKKKHPKRKSPPAKGALEIRGVVSPPGAGGGHSPGDKFWTLSFTLHPWKTPDGQLQKEPLDLFKNLPEKRVRPLMDSLDAYNVVRLLVKLDPEGGEAELVKVINTADPDPDLKKHSDKLKKPVTFRDPTFGLFKLNRGVNLFIARTQWNGKRVELSLDAENGVPHPKALALSKTLWKKSATWSKKAERTAIDQLLELKNDAWAEEDKQITAKQFVARMKLQTISIDPDGRIEFYYDDGGLFFGHCILITGSLTKGLTHATIAG